MHRPIPRGGREPLRGFSLTTPRSKEDNVRHALKLLVWVTLGLMPASLAFAAAPSVSPIGDMTLNAGTTMTVNVVAVDTDNDAITLTSSLPAFVTLNSPTSGSDSVVTTLTIAPTAGDVGSHSGSVTATAGGETDTEGFQITVNAAGTNQPPVVTAPALASGSEGNPIQFTVTATDPDADAITSLTATGAPTGSSFTPNGTFTSGTFSWTPTHSQAGQYDVTFTATNAGTGSATTHITVVNTDLGPISITPIGDVTLAEGSSMTVNVHVSDPDSGTVNVSATLPPFATLNAPTSETGTGSLATTITIAPGTGTAGSYTAYVTATTGGEAATDTFNITVTAPEANFETHASMIGNYNPHRQKICFRIRQSDASFDLRKVALGSVALHWNGATLVGNAKLAFDCDDDEGEADSLDVEHHGDGDDDECDDCEEDGDHDAAADDDCDGAIHVCFRNSALKDFFGDAGVVASLNDATIEGSLTTGETFIATLGSFKSVPPNHGDDHKKSPLTLRVKPNPLNPKADISFTLTQAGRVKIAIYDLRGRLVRTVLDETRAVGPQSVAWNGMDATEHRVASGTYFVHIQAQQGREVRSVTVLK